MTDVDIEQRVLRLESALSVARWQTAILAAVAAIAIAIVGFVCYRPAPKEIRIGDVVLDDSGLHIDTAGKGRLDLSLAEGLHILEHGETFITGNSIRVTRGDSNVALILGDGQAQLTLSRKSNRASMVSSDDNAEVRADGPLGKNMAVLSSTMGLVAMDPAKQ